MHPFKIMILGCLAALTAGCGKSEKTDEPAPPAEKTIALMSYNVLQDDAVRPAGYLWGEPDNRRDRLTALLQKYNPDILCAQEDYYQQGRYIMQHTGWGKVGVSRNAGTPTGDGEFVAIYYNRDRFTPEKWGHFWLSATPDKPSLGWDASVVRICNWALFSDKHSKASFYVFDTHMDQVGRQSRINSAALIADSIRQIAQGLPAILAGDMNTTPGSAASAEFRAALHDSRDITEKSPTGPAASFNGGDGRVPTRIIDYIYVNDGFKVHQYAILNDSTADGLFPSDHFPVLATLELK